MLRRVTRRMQVARRTNLADYAEYLVGNPEEAQELFGDLLISVTTFFRDPKSYEVLVREAIKPIFDTAGSEGIRAWVAGCATGEEAYSLAILFLEGAERRRLAIPIQIFATDLDEGALATGPEARAARSRSRSTARSGPDGAEAATSRRVRMWQRDRRMRPGLLSFFRARRSTRRQINPVTLRPGSEASERAQSPQLL